MKADNEVRDADELETWDNRWRIAFANGMPTIAQVSTYLTMNGWSTGRWNSSSIFEVRKGPDAIDAVCVTSAVAGLARVEQRTDLEVVRDILAVTVA